MRNGFLACVVALLTGAGAALAQPPSSLPPPLPAGTAQTAPAAPAAKPAAPGAAACADGACSPCSSCPVGLACPAACSAPGPCFWVDAEYLLWWIKGAPLSAPIATLGSPADTVPGALGQPNTRVVSPGTLNYGPFSGGRITLGGWLDDDRTWGVEGSAFLLETRTSQFFAGSAPGGPVFFVPFQDGGAVPPAESAFPFGAGGATSGFIAATNSTRLWGSEGNILVNLGRSSSFSLTGLAGFRYLDLAENLHMETLGAAGGTALISLDRFSTRNQFWGGQVGLRGEVRSGGLFANLCARVALGDMHESVNANGVSTFLGTTVQGGFFVLGSNFGRRTSDVFAVIPEVRTQVGYDVTDYLRVFVGYEFLYVSDVVRPGDQIDHRVNFTQQAAPVGGGGLVGPAVPAPQFRHTDFWAHGLNFGVSMRF